MPNEAMGLHNAGRAAPAASGNGSSKNVGLASTTDCLNTSPSVEKQAPHNLRFTCTADLVEHTERMVILVEWKQELERRLARAELCFEVGVIDLEEHDLLADEVHTFNRLCHAIASAISGRRSAP